MNKSLIYNIFMILISFWVASPVFAGKFESDVITLHDTSVTTTFTQLTFRQNYDVAPLVFAIASEENSDPCTIRVRNITTTGCEISQVEPDNQDGTSVAMTVHYLAIEPGTHELTDGTVIQAFTHDTQAVQFGTGVAGTEGWDSVAYSGFSSTPAVIAQVQTINNESGTPPGTPTRPWLTAALRNITSNNLQLALERAEVNTGTITVDETIGLLLIEGGLTGNFVDNNSNTVSYESQITPVNIRGWGNGCNPLVIVNFSASYPNPLVMASQGTHNGGDGGWLRRCSLSNSSVNFVVDEDQYANTERNHTTESAGILVFSSPFDADVTSLNHRRALEFDGIDDYVNIASNNNALNLRDQGTLEAWIKIESFTDEAGILWRGTTPARTRYGLSLGGPLFGNSSNQIGLALDGSAATPDTLAGITELSPNVWYHVAATWDWTVAGGQFMKIYINGIEDATQAKTTRLGANNDDNRIGWNESAVSFLNGQIDEVRIWNTARTEAEIRDYMCKKPVGNEPGLVGYWQFNEWDGTICIDHSLNNFTGVMTNMDPGTDRICSSAPIGNDSAYSYSSIFSAQLYSDPLDLTSDYFGADQEDGSWGSDSCLHVYKVNGPPNITTGPLFYQSFANTLHYWGIFVGGGESPTYTVFYKYEGYPLIVDENQLELAYRTNHCGEWNGTKASTITVGPDTLLTQSGFYGTEFILGKDIDSRICLDFDGTGDFVSVPDNSSLDATTAGTIEAWVYITTLQTNADIITKGNTTDGYTLHTDGITGNQIVFSLYNTSTSDTMTSATTLNTATWYHLAATWDGANMSLYINGVLDSGSQASTQTAGDSGNMTIASGNGNNFIGWIDEARVWTTAQTQPQVRSTMCKKLIGSEAGLGGYWRFDEDSGTNCPDYSSNSNDGTMSAGMVPADDRICSSAPIGDVSAYDYTLNTTSVNLAHPDGDDMTASAFGGDWGTTFTGLHVYRLDEAPVYPPDIATVPYAYGTIGLTPPPGWSSIDYYRYWGVFATDWSTGASEPTYDVIYNYDGNPSVPANAIKGDLTTPQIGLAKRDAYCDRTWEDSGANWAFGTMQLELLGANAQEQSQNGPPKTNPEYVLGGINQPLAIALASFYAEFDKSSDCIRISWETATEVDTIGFQIWRNDTKEGPYTLVPGSFMPSQSVSETTGAEYTFLDCDADLDTYMTYYYKLEEIDLDNEKGNPVYGPIGPVTETVSASQFSKSNASTKSDSGCFIDCLTLF